MSSNSNSNQKRIGALDARVAMINCDAELPPETLDQMNRIRAIVSDCGNQLNEIFQKSGAKIDVGRAIASLDHLQQVENVACVALILPHCANSE